MSNAKKQKHDGSCSYMCSDDSRFLVMRGDYDREAIIKAAVEQGQIDADYSKNWESAEYYQCHYKASPIGGAEGYSSWNHPRDTPCRGSYFASVLEWR